MGRSKKKIPGIHEVDTYSALSEKIDSLFHKVKSKSQSSNAAQVKKPSCEEYRSDHNTEDCPILVQGMEKLILHNGDNVNKITYIQILTFLFGGSTQFSLGIIKNRIGHRVSFSNKRRSLCWKRCLKNLWREQINTWKLIISL